MVKYYKPIPISELKLSKRMQYLRDELLNAPKSHSSLNARIAKESYDKTEGQPAIIRRAKALSATFHNMPIYIRDGELLVGNRSEALGVMPKLQDEYLVKNQWINDTRYESKDLYGYFQDNMSKEVKTAQDCLWAGYAAGSGSGFGHILADYNIVIKHGAYFLAEKAELQAKKFAEKGMQRQSDFCKASAISCRAFGDWGRRYSHLAYKLANECQNPERAAELYKIAEVCERVPAFPATNFYEAIQSMFFAHQAMHIEQQGGSISIGGFDRILYEYYMNDIENQVLSCDFVELLLENFYIKLMENAIWPRDVVMFANMAIGGQDADGNDISNDLTWMALDTTVKTGSTHPLLSLRWHTNIDQDLWLRAIEMLSLGMGLPAIFSDTKMIDAIVSWGISREEAVDYGIVGCIEPAIRGTLHGQTLGGHINMLMCLELAMNDGKRFMSDEQIGAHTGYLKDFKSMKDVWDAYKIQVEAACRIDMESVYLVARSQQENYSYPLMSSFMHNAIEDGRDLTYGVKWNFPTVCITGITNVVDSFLAMESLIDQSGSYTFADFYDALKNNFDGYEKLRGDIEKLDAKFGNGNPQYVDMYNSICEIHSDILKKQPGPRGDHFAPGLWPVTWHVSQGHFTGASADGRLAGEPLVDGAGPVNGRTKNGPTAVMLDMASVDCVSHWPGGYVLNMKFSKEMFRTKEYLNKLAGLIDTFFRMGGMQIQINTHSRELLKMAKANPEKYKDLIVRVAGYSAYFCTLGEDVQDEIISRAEVSL